MVSAVQHIDVVLSEQIIESKALGASLGFYGWTELIW